MKTPKEVFEIVRWLLIAGLAVFFWRRCGVASLMPLGVLAALMFARWQISKRCNQPAAYHHALKAFEWVLLSLVIVASALHLAFLRFDFLSSDIGLYLLMFPAMFLVSAHTELEKLSRQSLKKQKSATAPM